MLLQFLDVFLVSVNQGLKSLDLHLVVLNVIFVLRLEFLELLSLNFPVVLVFVRLAFL